MKPNLRLIDIERKRAMLWSVVAAIEFAVILALVAGLYSILQ